MLPIIFSADTATAKEVSVVVPRENVELIASTGTQQICCRSCGLPDVCVRCWALHTLAHLIFMVSSNLNAAVRVYVTM